MRKGCAWPLKCAGTKHVGERWREGRGASGSSCSCCSVQGTEWRGNRCKEGAGVGPPCPPVHPQAGDVAREMRAQRKDAGAWHHHTAIATSPNYSSHALMDGGMVPGRAPDSTPDATHPPALPASPPPFAASPRPPPAPSARALPPPCASARVVRAWVTLGHAGTPIHTHPHAHKTHTRSCTHTHIYTHKHTHMPVRITWSPYPASRAPPAPFLPPTPPRQPSPEQPWPRHCLQHMWWWCVCVCVCMCLCAKCAQL